MDVEQLPDGSLLVSDDAPGGGIVYRVSYSPPTACRNGNNEDVQYEGTPASECAARLCCACSPLLWVSAAHGQACAPLHAQICLKLEVARGSDYCTSGRAVGCTWQGSTLPDASIHPRRSARPAAIPGAEAGCTVNVGLLGTPSAGVLRYRRCVRFQAPAGSGRWVQVRAQATLTLANGLANGTQSHTSACSCMCACEAAAAAAAPAASAVAAGQQARGQPLQPVAEPVLACPPCTPPPPRPIHPLGARSWRPASCAVLTASSCCVVLWCCPSLRA